MISSKRIGMAHGHAHTASLPNSNMGKRIIYVLCTLALRLAPWDAGCNIARYALSMQNMFRLRYIVCVCLLICMRWLTNGTRTHRLAHSRGGARADLFSLMMMMIIIIIISLSLYIYIYIYIYVYLPVSMYYTRI